jgi:hypothetical protein
MSTKARPKASRDGKLPRWALPKLSRGQLLDLDLAHHENLDGIHAGEQNETLLWHLVESVYTWSKVAELLQRHEAEMALQLEMATALVQRYARTGVIGFEQLEYRVACRGVGVMSELARATDVATAMEAAAWSEELAAGLRAQAGPAQAEAMARGLALTAEVPLRGGGAAVFTKEGRR